MNFLHSHVWSDISTHYVSPIESTDEVERYGYTRLYQKCVKCGEYQDCVKPGHLVIKDVPETVDVAMKIHRIIDDSIL